MLHDTPASNLGTRTVPPPGGTANVTLQPGQWFQWNEILKASGLRQGYVRVFRVSGTSPFLAYGVVNDGGSGRPGTNDGSYVPMLPGR